MTSLLAAVCMPVLLAADTITGLPEWLNIVLGGGGVAGGGALLVKFWQPIADSIQIGRKEAREATSRAEQEAREAREAHERAREVHDRAQEQNIKELQERVNRLQERIYHLEATRIESIRMPMWSVTRRGRITFVNQALIEAISDQTGGKNEADLLGMTIDEAFAASPEAVTALRDLLRTATNSSLGRATADDVRVVKDSDFLWTIQATPQMNESKTTIGFVLSAIIKISSPVRVPPSLGGDQR